MEVGGVGHYGDMGFRGVQEVQTSAKPIGFLCFLSEDVPYGKLGGACVFTMGSLS